MPGRAAAPAANPDQPTDPPVADAAPASTTPRWVYVSDDPLIYTNVPVTPVRGDVVEWPGRPGVDKDGQPTTIPGPPADDGRWELTADAVTRLPDNHPDHIAAAEAAQVAAAEQKEG